MTDIDGAVRAALAAEPAITSVDLVGSRARDDAGEYSDWDFKVQTTDFTRVADRMPDLTAPMKPLGSLWDPLSEHWCYMLMLPGPTKIDFIFDEAHKAEPPWTTSPNNAGRIDSHFWDWIWWLASKDQRHKSEFVSSELGKLSWFLLRPLGIDDVPPTVAAAVDAYVSRREATASPLETEVRAGLRRLGYDA